jgi:hypothetical protein
MNDLESYQTVVARYCEPDDRAVTTKVSMGHCLRTGADPRRLFQYIESIAGFRVSKLDDLMWLNRLPEEEELTCTRCREGLLISHARDGWFLLVTE